MKLLIDLDCDEEPRNNEGFSPAEYAYSFSTQKDFDSASHFRLTSQPSNLTMCLYSSCGSIARTSRSPGGRLGSSGAGRRTRRRLSARSARAAKQLSRSRCLRRLVWTARAMTTRLRREVLPREDWMRSTRTRAEWWYRSSALLSRPHRWAARPSRLLRIPSLDRRFLRPTPPANHLPPLARLLPPTRTPRLPNLRLSPRRHSQLAIVARRRPGSPRSPTDIFSGPFRVVRSNRHRRAQRRPLLYRRRRPGRPWEPFPSLARRRRQHPLRLRRLAVEAL